MRIQTIFTPGRPRRTGLRAFTLAEVVMAVFISTLAFSAIVQSYTLTTRRAQWSGYSLAAQALAVQQLERARAAVWDTSNQKNELTNMNLTAWTWNNSTGTGRGHTVGVLDLPVAGTNQIIATNFVTVRMLHLNNQSTPPVQIQFVRVDTVWPFGGFHGRQFYTNSIANYYAPDNRTL